MRHAKIVCTLGPASNSPEVLSEMIKAGMNVARLNFSHGTHDDHRATYAMVRELSQELRRPVAILQDLQGPKIRVGTFETGSVELARGDEFVITVDDIIGDQERVSTTYKDLHRDVRPGDILLLDDGLIRLRVVDVQGPDVRTLVEVAGTLKNNKGINLPTAAVSAPSMTEKDREDLEFGMELGVDYVALSFVRSALDIHQLRSRMPESAAESIKIISKIEKPQAIAEIDDIIAVSDGIMIARGDLGVEMPPQKVPMLQKMCIARANEQGRLTITATQMLESMTENFRPTRAEASDVANAILDGTDAVMLSGETAAGRYPIEAVRMMSSIIEEVERSPRFHSLPEPRSISHLKTFPNAVARAAAIAADELSVSGLVVLTTSGATARLMMTYRPTNTIIACTPSEQVYRQMALYWGVEPYLLEMSQSTDLMLQRAEDLMRRERGAKKGDEIIVVMGSPAGHGTETNLIKFHRLG
ncbi:pyruvate kinase [Lujinxingia vulgaris]|uniref:Pyruvate kinase n=1 Tax=Lujinxingia vulgaris TaxID=2600176 RepID=A0A5C6X8F5_9DELT|nr:pyruvate kinase [Lujinxingia vulgaris]TXD37628.1 pyruvate kinase [Lujinxingia vulgaris]